MIRLLLVLGVVLACLVTLIVLAALRAAGLADERAEEMRRSRR